MARLRHALTKDSPFCAPIIHSILLNNNIIYTIIGVHLAMSSFCSYAALLAIIARSIITSSAPLAVSASETSYGVDVSFPQHHARVVSGVGGLPDRQDFYDAFLENCRLHDHDACDENENDRIAMNLRQPQGMVNYTELGFAKAKVPDKVFRLIKKFWEDNLGMEEVEDWDTGNTYTNHVSCHYISGGERLAAEVDLISLTY